MQECSVARVWLATRLGCPGKPSIYPSKISYDDVSIIGPLAIVKSCTLTFTDVPSEIHAPDFYWLVFDMGHDYLMYGPICVEDVGVIDLTNEKERISLLFRNERGRYFGPNGSPRSESWFRVVPIPISMPGAASTINFRVSFSFVFFAQQGKQKTSLNFQFPMFCDEDKVRRLVSIGFISIRERGEHMNVVGIPGNAQVEPVFSDDGINLHFQWKNETKEKEEIDSKFVPLSIWGVGETDLILKAGNIAIRSHTPKDIPEMLENVAHIIIPNTDLANLRGYSPTDHAKGIAELLGRCIPQELKLCYYWNASAGTFERRQKESPTSEVLEQSKLVDDIVKYLRDKSKAAPLDIIHLWLIHPVDTAELCEKQITDPLKKFNPEIHHVLIATKENLSCDKIPTLDGTSCFLPHAFCLTAELACTIRKACFGGKDEGIIHDFPVVWPSWPGRMMYDVHPWEEKKEEYWDITSDRDLEEEREVIQLVDEAMKIIDGEERLASFAPNSTKGIFEIVKEAEEEASRFVEKLPASGKKHVFSRMWALSVRPKEDKGVKSWIIEPAVNGKRLELDIMTWRQYVYWPGKEEAEKLLADIGNLRRLLVEKKEQAVNDVIRDIRSNNRWSRLWPILESKEVKTFKDVMDLLHPWLALTGEKES